jgi:hypothetical protein
MSGMIKLIDTRSLRENIMQKRNPLVREYAQFAIFGLAWAIFALIAYYLPLQPLTLQANAMAHTVCQNATPLALPGIKACDQHVAFPTQVAGTTLVLLPIPIAAILLVILGIVARIQTPNRALSTLFLLVAVVRRRRCGLHRIRLHFDVRSEAGDQQLYRCRGSHRHLSSHWASVKADSPGIQRSPLPLQPGDVDHRLCLIRPSQFDLFYDNHPRRSQRLGAGDRLCAADL